MIKNKITKGLVNNADKSVSERIKIARLLRGLNQRQVAEALGVSIQQIQKYEKSTNRISSGRLYYLAKFLRLPITYFFDRDENNTELMNIADIGEKDTITLINSFNLIENVRLRKHLIAVVQLISE